LYITAFYELAFRQRKKEGVPALSNLIQLPTFYCQLGKCSGTIASCAEAAQWPASGLAFHATAIFRMIGEHMTSRS
jgi:hypothetical protein